MQFTYLYQISWKINIHVKLFLNVTTLKGAVSDFWSGGCKLASEAGELTQGGGPKKNPSTYKHRSDIWLNQLYILI